MAASMQIEERLRTLDEDEAPRDPLLRTMQTQRGREVAARSGDVLRQC